MSDDRTQYGEPHALNRARQWMVGTLRQIADAVDALPPEELADAMLLLPGAAEDFFAKARLVFRRPFGE